MTDAKRIQVGWGAPTIGDVSRRPIPIRLDAELIAQIDEIARADDRPRSSMIRRLLTEAVAARQAKDGRRPGKS